MHLKRLILILASLTTFVALAACSPLAQEDADGGGQRTPPKEQNPPEKTQEPTEVTQGMEDSSEDETIAEPATDETLKLTVPKMERVQDVTIPTAVADEEGLRNNLAVRIPDTGLPWEKETNVYIAGHELGYEGTPSYLAFYDLKAMEEGDEIYITDANGTKYTYEVFEILIVQPTDLWVLDPLEGKNIVSLQGSETQQQVGDTIPKRVVRAELKDVEE